MHSAEWPRGIIDCELDRLEELLNRGDFEELDANLGRYVQDASRAEAKIHYALFLSAFRFCLAREYTIAADLLLSLFTLYPHASRIRNELGITYALMGRFADAQKLPNIDLCNGEDYSDFFYCSALIRKGLGDIQESRDLCLQALDATPTHRRSLVLYYSMIDGNNEIQEALARATRLLRDNPFDISTRKDKALLLYQLGEVDSAHNELLILNHLRPQDSEIIELMKSWGATS